MKTLSGALNTALGGAVQRPAWLVYIGWSSPVYLSTHGTVSWDSKTWNAADVDVSRIKIDAANVQGTLSLGNADDVYGTLLLAEGVSDKVIKIYGYDAAATATSDIVEMVICVGGRGTLTGERVEIGLRDGNAFVYAPRTFITATPGSPFTYLMPAGAVLQINGQAYRVERR